MDKHPKSKKIKVIAAWPCHLDGGGPGSLGVLPSCPSLEGVGAPEGLSRIKQAIANDHQPTAKPTA
eukprot:6196932-Pleurochrysis_carterae.AAC.1